METRTAIYIPREVNTVSELIEYVWCKAYDIDNISPGQRKLFTYY